VQQGVLTLGSRSSGSSRNRSRLLARQGLQGLALADVGVVVVQLGVKCLEGEAGREFLLAVVQQLQQTRETGVELLAEVFAQTEDIILEVRKDREIRVLE